MVVCLGSFERSEHTLPRWLVETLKVYYLEVRPYFLSSEGVGKFERRILNGINQEDFYVINTEIMFINSGGNADFRARTCVDQFTAGVSIFRYLKLSAEELNYLSDLSDKSTGFSV